MASFIYRTHMDWDSPPHWCMLRIYIRYSCHLPPLPLLLQFNINLSQHIILLPHLPSYCCPIIIYCLRSAQEDQCPIMTSTQSKALWCESMPELHASCRKKKYIGCVCLCRAQVGEKRGGPQSLWLHYKVFKIALWSVERKLGSIVRLNQQPCGFVLSAWLDSGGKWVDE